jgi:hypothetical protein
MKKVLLLSLIFAFATITQAQTSDKKWGLGFGAGAYGALNDGGMGLMPELYFSGYLSPKLDILLKGNLGLFNSKLTSTTDLAAPFLNLRYNLSDESKKFRPYLYAGPGFLADNSEEGLSFNLGVGGKYYLGSATALYLDADTLMELKPPMAQRRLGIISGRQLLELNLTLVRQRILIWMEYLIKRINVLIRLPELQSMPMVVLLIPMVTE